MYSPAALVVSPAGLRSVVADEPSARAPGRAPAGSRTPRDRVTISAGARSGRLSPEQERVVAELRGRDAEVRAHEAAHQAAGGDVTGAASFTYQTGPDGRTYAVGGEVPVELRSGRTPGETIALAQRVRRAALAPANPSAQDLAVAAAASRLEADARTRKAREASDAYAQATRKGSAVGPDREAANGTAAALAG